MTHRVAVITGFFESPDFLKVLFQHLQQQSFFDFDVYVYNYRYAKLEEIDAAGYTFNYTILKLSANAGFAGGNNYAIKEANKKYDYSFYALINDDTKPDVDWLKTLVELASTETNIGAVTSKMVYYEPFIELNGITLQQQNSGDNRELGIRFYLNSSFDESYYNKRFFLKGFYHQEEDEINTFRWTASRFTIALPVARAIEGFEMYRLRLFIRKNKFLSNQKLKLFIGNFALPPIELNDDQLFYEVMIPKTVILNNQQFIIQNAGSDYDVNLNGFDIGAGERDKGQYNDVREVNMFCGGACLISKIALEKAGLFNAHFFSYYEDSDLSLRLRKQGFKILYNPSSLVLHYHSGSSVEWSPFFTYYVFRNKIIFSGKHFGAKAYFKAYKERIKETWLYFKWARKNNFSDPMLQARLKLNVRILVDAVAGLIKYKPAKF